MANKLIFSFFLLVFSASVFSTEARKDSAPNKPSKKTRADTVKTSPQSLSYEMVKGKPLEMNFTLPLNPLSDPDLLFSHFSNRNLLIFYFSVKCMHCQKALPHFQKLASELEPYGVSAIAIAVRNNTDSDMRDFIRQNNFSFPIFHDYKKAFSSLYGTGRLPLTVIVNKEGKMLRFRDFNAQKTAGQIKTLLVPGASKP
ncbi:TlpA disulfide reductase family protein [Fibrobacterota bacterium]